MNYTLSERSKANNLCQSAAFLRHWTLGVHLILKKASPMQQATEEGGGFGRSSPGDDLGCLERVSSSL